MTWQVVEYGTVFTLLGNVGSIVDQQDSFLPEIQFYTDISYVAWISFCKRTKEKKIAGSIKHWSSFWKVKLNFFIRWTLTIIMLALTLIKYIYSF